MKTIQSIATLTILAALANVAGAQPTRTETGPVRPAAPSSPREPGEGPQKPALDQGAIRVDVDGIAGVLSALAVDQDFAIGEQTGRRQPQATVTLTREPDEFTAALLRGHTRGTRFREVTISGHLAAGARSRSTLRLGDVVIEAVRLRTSANGSEEAVTLRFGKVSWNDGDGNTFEWNYATMSAR